MSKKPTPKLEDRLNKLSKRTLMSEVVMLTAKIADLKAELAAAMDRLSKATEFVEGYHPETKRLSLLMEVKKTGQNKASDLSQRYTTTLETNNPNLLDLGKLPYEAMLEVTFDLSEQKIKT